MVLCPFELEEVHVARPGIDIVGIESVVVASERDLMADIARLQAELLPEVEQGEVILPPPAIRRLVLQIELVETILIVLPDRRFWLPSPWLSILRA
jgi:hypothetical protein